MIALFTNRAAAALLSAFLAVPAAVALAGAPALADDDGAAADAGAGVARLSLITGTVTVQRGDDEQQTAGAVNAPLEGGDFLTTGDGRSLGEVQFSDVTQLRLDNDTQLRFTKLEDGERDVQLAQGTLELALLRGPDGTTQIDTPSISVRPRDRGDYRVSVTNDGNTIVTVRAGRADVLTPSGTQTIGVGQTLYAQGPAANPTTNLAEAIGFDEFDTFNADRDREYDRELANAQWTNPYVDGVGDLYHYGRWVDDGSYGNVWVPAGVAPGWAPYHDGRWVWEGDYGWTWVAAEPWGWAPYHYGRWYHSAAYGWAWYPPPPVVYAPVVVYRPPVVYQPALVAFFTFGGGGGVSVGFGGGFGGGGFGVGFGNIGWVPLAPFEAYHPWYGGGFGGYGNHYGPTIVNRTTIVNNYNITNINNGNITKIYANANAPGAVATVDSRRFVEGNFTQTRSLSPAQLRSLPNAAAVQGPLPVVPTKQNLHFGTPAAPGSAVALNPAFRRSEFAGRAAPAPVPFETQRTQVATLVKPLALKAANPAALPPTAPDAFRNPHAQGAVGLSGRAGVADLAPVRPEITRGVGGGAGDAGFASGERSTPGLRASTHPVNPAAGSGTGASPALGTPNPRGDAWSRFQTNRGTSAGTLPVRPLETPGVRAGGANPGEANPGGTNPGYRALDAGARTNPYGAGPRAATGAGEELPHAYVAKPNSHPYVANPHPYVANPHPYIANPHPYVANPHPYVANPHPLVQNPHPYHAVTQSSRRPIHPPPPKPDERKRGE